MYVKRVFDIICAACLLLLLSWALVIGWLLAVIDTNTNGIFKQVRIGQYAKPFIIYKLRTIHPETEAKSAIGRFLRAYKIDELPQLFNVLKGEMSMVGPRPDLPGLYDNLQEEDKVLLQLKPGITGPASLKYANEEEILSRQQDPKKYSREVIFPDKIRINKEYLENRSLKTDLKIMLYTALGKRFNDDNFK
jgi:lipopolysaccharide/colanic/teichoic acid biosynthesis glycosyltransferase